MNFKIYLMNHNKKWFNLCKYSKNIFILDTFIKKQISFNTSDNKKIYFDEFIDKSFIYKINFNVVDKYGNNGLMLACKYNGDKDVIKYITNLNININQKNNDGETALLLLCLHNYDYDLLYYFITKLKSDINVLDNYNNNIFSTLCVNNCVLNIKKFHDNYNVDINKTNLDGDNALMFACANNNINVIKYLINELKMNINYKNNNNYDILHASCYNKDINVFKYILNIFVPLTNIYINNLFRVIYTHCDNIDVIIFYMNKYNLTFSNIDVINILKFNKSLNVIKYIINYITINNNLDNYFTIIFKYSSKKIKKYIFNLPIIHIQLDKFTKKELNIIFKYNKLKRKQKIILTNNSSYNDEDDDDKLTILIDIFNKNINLFIGFDDNLKIKYKFINKFININNKHKCFYNCLKNIVFSNINSNINLIKLIYKFVDINIF